MKTFMPFHFIPCWILACDVLVLVLVNEWITSHSYPFHLHRTSNTFHSYSFVHSSCAVSTATFQTTSIPSHPIPSVLYQTYSQDSNGFFRESALKNWERCLFDDGWVWKAYGGWVLEGEGKGKGKGCFRGLPQLFRGKPGRVQANRGLDDNERSDKIGFGSGSVVSYGGYVSLKTIAKTMPTLSNMTLVSVFVQCVRWIRLYQKSQLFNVLACPSRKPHTHSCFSSSIRISKPSTPLSNTTQRNDGKRISYTTRILHHLTTTPPHNPLLQQLWSQPQIISTLPTDLVSLYLHPKHLLTSLP